MGHRSLSHQHRSGWVSKQWMMEAECISKASNTEQWVRDTRKWKNKQTSKWPSTHVPILGVVLNQSAMPALTSYLIGGPPLIIYYNRHSTRALFFSLYNYRCWHFSHHQVHGVFPSTIASLNHFSRISGRWQRFLFLFPVSYFVSDAFFLTP